MNSTKRLIVNGEIVTDMGIEKKNILISNDRIIGIYEHNHDVADCEIIDAQNKYIFPGLVNTHTHLFQTVLKGLGRDLNLIDWLNASIRPNLTKLLPEDYYWAAMLGLMDGMQSGTTTVLDYMYANIHEEAAAYVIKAFEDIGMRGILARGWSDRKKSELSDLSVEDTENVLRSVDSLNDKYASDMMNLALAPTAIWNMELEGLKLAADYSKEKNMLFTMHINETADDTTDSMRRFGKEAIPLLDELGCITEKFLGVHCVTLSPEDIAIFAENNSSVSFNPLSNMILGSGIAPIPEIMASGVNVSIATDGAASNDAQDMLEVMKTGSLLLKAAYKDPSIIKAHDFFNMATTNGAKALGLGADIGNIEIGKKADLFIYNPETAKSIPVYNPVTSLIYSSDKENIDEVLIDGKTVYRKGGWTQIDRDRVFYEVKRISLRINQ